MEHSPHATQRHSDSRSSSLRDLGSERLEQHFSLRPLYVGPNWRLKDRRQYATVAGPECFFWHRAMISYSDIIVKLTIEVAEMGAE